MNFYPEDYIVEVVVPFTNLNGEPVTPIAMRAKLLNGDDVVLNDFGDISIQSGSGQRVITIAAIFNAIEDGNIREARILKVELDTASGTIFKRHSYAIEAEQTLEVMTNTFQSFESAEIAAINYVNLTGWNTASETRRRAALVESYGRIVSIPMKYSPRDDTGAAILSCEQRIAREDWVEMTRDDFTLLPTHFKRALRAAQLLEANELLAGDSIGQRHRAGIVTETIGESSMTLRAGRIDYGLSQPAMSALAGYISFNIGVARA